MYVFFVPLSSVMVESLADSDILGHVLDPDRIRVQA